jgi:O-6-methylguanine DNA methyltransferase
LAQIANFCYDQPMLEPSFREVIYHLLRQLPQGKVATYGQLAELAGHPRAARAVGSFMKTNPDAPQTPCHRVVASDGKLTGYSAKGGVPAKKAMLLAEGVAFSGDRVNLAKSLWHPKNFSALT